MFSRLFRRAPDPRHAAPTYGPPGPRPDQPSSDQSGPASEHEADTVSDPAYDGSDDRDWDSEGAPPPRQRVRDDPFTSADP